MNTYVILLRGVNVGGKNKISMTELKRRLEEEGFDHVTTYLNSGNVILKSKLGAKTLSQKIESVLSEKFNSPAIKVLALTHKQLQAVIDKKPEGFGEEPNKYYSDAIFLMDIDAAEAMPVFNPREGVDKVWSGDGVIYSQRLSAQRTKSRLSKIAATPVYKSMTIRSWSTTTKLLEILKKTDSDR
jgi:uncharacterized protein (DUF1697 family)